MNTFKQAEQSFAMVWIINQDKCFFFIGDYGDKFYILLQGQVAVLVPRKKDKNAALLQSQGDDQALDDYNFMR